MQRILSLPSPAKFSIVFGGYACAIALSIGVVWFHSTFQDQLEREASAGMYGFGDALLFAMVFGVVSIIPTGFALAFLRTTRGFWVVLSAISLLIASVALAVIAATAAGSTNPWAMLAFPRLFISPFLAAAFGLAAWFAPAAGFRACLLGATAIEVIGAVSCFFHWFLPLLLGR
jgi:hypothetical protein